MDQLLEQITLYKICAIFGRLRSGKTALAVYLAGRLLQDGLVDGVISNFPTIYPACATGPDDGTLLNKCLLWDEAWAQLDSRTSMSNDRTAGAFYGKYGAIAIFPTVHPIDKRLRVLSVRLKHKSLITGNTTWTYSAGDGKDAITGELVFNSKWVYNKYATAYVPVDNCGITQRFLLTYRLWTGTEYDVSADTERQKMEAMSLGGQL